MRRLWLVRLGKNGEFERLALDKGLLRIGFGVESEISNLKDRDGLLRLMESIFPDAKSGKQRNFASQVNQFVNVAAGGDLIVSPMKTTSTIAIGRFSGPYAPGPKGEVTRPVEWLRVDIKRDAFKQDLLYSFGAIMTVCEISRNDALSRVEQVLKTGIDPGDGLTLKGTGSASGEASGRGRKRLPRKSRPDRPRPDRETNCFGVYGARLHAAGCGDPPRTGLPHACVSTRSGSGRGYCGQAADRWDWRARGLSFR